jgi:hypothetical protein
VAIVHETSTITSNTIATTLHTVTKPSGTASGDVLIAAIAFNGSPGTLTLPSGWVQIAASIAITNPKVYGWYLIAGGSEPADYTWTSTTTITSGCGISRYSGVDTSTVLDAAGVATSGAIAAGGSLTGVTTVTNNAMVIAAMGVNSGSTIITEASTVVVERWEAAGKHCEHDSDIFVTAGATGTIDYTFSASREWAGWVAALLPASVAAAVAPEIMHAIYR